MPHIYCVPIIYIYGSRRTWYYAWYYGCACRSPSRRESAGSGWRSNGKRIGRREDGQPSVASSDATRRRGCGPCPPRGSSCWVTRTGSIIAGWPPPARWGRGGRPRSRSTGSDIGGHTCAPDILAWPHGCAGLLGDLVHCLPARTPAARSVGAAASRDAHCDDRERWVANGCRGCDAPTSPGERLRLARSHRGDIAHTLRHARHPGYFRDRWIWPHRKQFPWRNRERGRPGVGLVWYPIRCLLEERTHDSRRYLS